MAPLKRPLQEHRYKDEVEAHDRPTKQQRMAKENYEKGTIIKIRCKDFMTYKEATFRPSPRLNLILAPNGAGKSSLTCAMALGLAADPKILGRADRAINFIKRGAEEAFTEVTLSAGPGKRPYVIQRTLKKDNMSRYKVNGKEQPRSHVVQLMQDLNVQLDNLCQFLPQDRVQSFAQMTPKQLLEESERALADGKYYQLHQELVEESKDLENIQRSTGLLERRLEDEEKLLAEVQRDKDRHDQREQLERKAQVLESRLAWLLYDEAYNKAAETQDKVKAAKKNLADRKRQLDESQAPIKERKDALDKQNRIVSQIKAAANKADSAMDAANNQCVTQANKAQEKWDQIENLKKQAERQQEDVARAEAALAIAKEDLENLPNAASQNQSQNTQDLDALKAEIRDLSAQVTEYEQNIAELKGNLDDYSRDLNRLQGQAKRLDDAKNVKLRQLEQTNRGITDFTRWVEKSRADGLFRGDVLGPILLEVSVPDAQHAKYVEQQLPNNMWQRFVTLFHEDQDLLRKAAHDKGYRGLFCTNYTGSTTSPLQYPDGTADQYRMLGVTHTLDQVFNAPLVIKKVINDESLITKAFVGSDTCDWKALMADEHRVSNLYTPESCYRKSSSTYNRAAKYKSVIAIREGLKFLGGAQDDKEEREHLQRAIAEVGGTVDNIKSEGYALGKAKEQAAREVADKRTALRRLENQALERKNRKSKLEAAVKVKERTLATMQRKPDPMQGAAALQRDITRLNGQLEMAVKKILAEFKALGEHHRELGCASALLHEIKVQVTALQAGQTGADTAVRQAENLLTALRGILAMDKEACSRKKEEALALTGDLDDSPGLKADLDALSGDLDELRADVERLHDEAAAIQCANPRVLQEYKERTERIRELREEFTTASTDLQTLTTAVEEKKDSWLPEVKRMVGVVDEHFRRMLRNMGCNGQVSLHCGCPEFDGCNAFDKYAIHIRVKFRDEEALQLLTANRQSGGERAVCTILYIIALQHVTVTPFRVVDEINQGMDRINERKVFIQMVDAACRPGTPQCFMFTPKLLPDLPYTHDVMPMTIFNGMHNEALTGDYESIESFAKGMPAVYKGPIVD